MNRFIRPSFALVAFAFALASVTILPASAQVQPNLESGFKFYGSYDSSTIDTVNLANGGLTLHIPLPLAYPQRGGKLDASYFLVSNSKSWQVQQYQPSPTLPITFYWNYGPPLSGGGNAFEVAGPLGPYLTNTLNLTFTRNWFGEVINNSQFVASDSAYRLTTWDNAVHQLADVSGNRTAFESVDTTGFHVVPSNPDPTWGTPNSITVTDRNGNVYQGSMPSNSGSCTRTPPRTSPSTVYCTQVAGFHSVKDANGNVYNATDTLNRNTPILPGVLQSNTTGCVSSVPLAGSVFYGYTGPSGVAEQFQACLGNVTLQTNFGQSGVSEFPLSIPGTDSPNPAPLIVTLILPDSTKWTFNYDSYGNVTYVGLPTGGSISYTWTTIAVPNCGLDDAKVSRAVATRTVYDGTHSNEWIYTWGAWSGSTVTNVVTDPLNNDVVHVFTSLGGTASCSPYETASKSYSGLSTGGGQLLREVDTTYSYGGVDGDTNSWATQVANVVPTNITTSEYPSGIVTATTKSYDAGYGTNAPIFGNVTSESVYDWGSGAHGALLKTTATTYNFQINSSYLDGNLPDLPTSIVVSNGAGYKCAETDYTYDNSSYLTASNVTTQHGAPLGPVRGNLSSTTRQLSSIPCQVGATWSPVTSYTNMYDTGEVYQSIDPLGHATTYSYSSTFDGAYPTTITNALSQSTTKNYDFSTGLLTSVTDPNQASTSFSYDSMFRRSEVAYPDGGSTSYCYTDLGGLTCQQSSAPPYDVVVTKAISSSPVLNETSTTVLDGLGRISQTQLNSDPDGATFTATTYDALGRKYTTTNPYRSTSDSTYGITTYTYDPLWRITQVAEPDGTSVLTSYSGNQTTVTDEAGSQRVSTIDSLGRLIEVDEPGTGSQGDRPASGTVTIGGSEQPPIPATQSTGGFLITLSPGSGGTITLYVNGVTVASVTYVAGADVGTVTQSLVSAINGNPSSPVTASDGGQAGHHGQVGIASIAYGSATNYTMSGTPTGIVQASGSTMTGGADPIYDTGTVSISVDGFGGFSSSSARYGSGSTPASIVAALYSGFSASGSPVVASLSGNVITLTSIDAGSSSNYPLSASVSQDPLLRHEFPNPSFTATSSGSTLTGGSNDTFGTAPLVTLYTYDALNNLTCAVQKGTDTTGFTSCAAAPPTWRPRSFVYDSLSRLTSSTNPESNTEAVGGILVPTTYTYDANGNLTSKVVPAQNQQSTATTPISYCYDALNRLTAKSYSSSASCASPVATYSYDQSASACYNVGRRTGMIDPAGSEGWCYDKMGRVLTDQRTTNGLTKSTTYSYLPYVDGSINSVTYPSGRVVTYTTGQAERLLTASDSTTSYASGVHYAPQGAIAALVNNSNLSSTEIYNNRLQPCWMYTTSGTALATSSPCTGTATTGNFQDLKYNFALGVSDNGNVVGIVNNRDTTRSQFFAYDALNRLQSAHTTSTYATSPTHCWGESYGVDGWGNMSAMSVLNSQYTGCTQEPGFSVTATVQNQLPITGNKYDSAGNLTTEMVGGVPYNYTYNTENQTTSMTGVSTTTNYLYDGDGKRVEKTGSKIYWYGADGEVLDETDATGSFTDANFSEYIYFGDKRIARRDSLGDVFYYFADHLGTSRTMAQVPSGQTTATLCYDADFYPFGGEQAYTNICTQNYKFTGKERDTESNLDEFGARYYASSVGRFMTPDWAAAPTDVPYANFGNPQSLNLYSYVENNPTTLGDLDGHDGTEGGVVEDAIDVISEEANAVANAVRASEAAKGLGTAAAVGAALGLEAYTLLDAHAIQVKAAADMQMQVEINKNVQQINKNKQKDAETKETEPQTSTDGANKKGGGKKPVDPDSNKKADDLISGSGKRLDSYHSALGGLTKQQIFDLAAKGDPKARQMKKLIQQRDRLQQKSKNKPKQ